MIDKQWTTNCILVGAQAITYLREGREEDAKTYLSRLSSELTPEDVEYLLFRLRKLAGLVK